MRLGPSDFETVQLQAVVFTPGGQLAMPRLLLALLERHADVLNGEALSLPSDTLIGSPPLILRSADEQFVLEISPLRAAFTWTQQDVSVQGDVEGFLALAVAILYSYLEVAPALAGRLGFVIYRVASEAQPARSLAEHFCQERWLSSPFNRPENFELHAHKIFRLSERFEVNSWVRCKTGKRALQNGADASPEPQPILFIEQDINTLSEIAGEVTYDREAAQQFFGFVANELDAILCQYFPGD